MFKHYLYVSGTSDTYREYLSSEWSNQRNLGGNLSLDVQIAPKQPFGANLGAGLVRTVNPTASGDPNLMFARNDALANGEVERRDMLGFAADALDVVLAADDAMRDALPEGALDGVDDTLVDPHAYISGDTLAPLTRLEGTPGLE
jgi:hypothetical protein